jgi:hypothetical protein
MYLTWGELKEIVDIELKLSGKDDSIEINYIDISFPDKGGPRRPQAYIQDMLVVH